ncbi:rhodanase-like protein [Citrobacter freundii]|nr:rhodanase-like protein [Citrobacter freundii]
MPVLHNRISNDALKAKMLAETEPRTTISFYKYFTIANPQHTRDALYQIFTALNVFGRVYLAHGRNQCTNQRTAKQCRSISPAALCI